MTGITGISTGTSTVAERGIIAIKERGTIAGISTGTMGISCSAAGQQQESAITRHLK